MDDEIKAILRKNLEVAEDSLDILRKMRRDIIIGRVAKAIKWLVMVGVFAFLFVQIQPYIQHWNEVLTNISTNIENFNNFFNR